MYLYTIYIYYINVITYLYMYRQLCYILNPFWSHKDLSVIFLLTLSGIQLMGQQ